MARASAASKGHNWRLKVFTRALIQMEGLHIPLVRPVLFHLIIIYMNLHRPSCPCSPVFKQIKFYLCNKYKFTLQQFSIHPRPYLEIFNPLLPVRWNFQSTFTHTLKFSIHFYPYVEIFNSLLPVRFKVRAGMDWKTTFSIHFYPYVWEIKFSSFFYKAFMVEFGRCTFL